MKKTYETPSVEKISFNYRDQVVAASGGSRSSGSSRTDGSFCGRVEDFINQVANVWGDWRICY